MFMWQGRTRKRGSLISSRFESKSAYEELCDDWRKGRNNANLGGGGTGEGSSTGK